MKILLTYVSILLAFSAPLFAQTDEPEQSPDVVDATEQAGASEAPAPLSQKETSLIQSAYKGDLATVETLISIGIAVDVQDKKKRTSLILAANNGHTSVVEFLFDHGADLNARDSDGQSALIYASRRSFNETAAFLLNNGADVNYQSRKKGVTALMIAAGGDNEELVQMLLEHGADASLTNTFGQTAKFLAQEMGNADVVALLPDAANP